MLAGDYTTYSIDWNLWLKSCIQKFKVKKDRHSFMPQLLEIQYVNRLTLFHETMNHVGGKSVHVDIYSTSPAQKVVKAEFDKVLKGQAQFSPSTQKESILYEIDVIKEEVKFEKQELLKKKQQ